MAEKAVAIVGLQNEVWLVEAVDLREADATMIAQTDNFGVLFGTVPVEMMEEVSGRQDIFPNAGLSSVRLQVGELFPNKRCAMTFLRLR